MNDPLDQKLSAHFKTPASEQLPGQDFSLRVLAALPAAKPRSALAGLLDYVLTWDAALLAVAATLAIAFYLPSEQNSPALAFVDQLLGLFTTWPALLSLGAVVAVTLLLNDEEGDELSRRESAWF